MEENIPFERAILYPYGEVTTDKENQCPTRPLYREIAFGNYEDALKREDCQKAFTFHERPNGKSNSIAQFYKHNFKTFIETEGKIAEKVVFCIGVACLQLFVQSNFCGPLVDPSQTFIPNLIPKESNETEVRELALEELVLPNTDGIYSLVSHPELLILARVVFLDLQSCLPSFVSTNWWCLRYAFVHQKIVDESSGILGDTIFKCLEEIENSTITDRERFSDLYSLFHLEAGNCSLYYFKVNRAEAHINKALHALGVKLTKNGDLIVRKCVIREQMEKQASLSKDVPKNVKAESDTVISNLRSIQHMGLLAKIVLIDRFEEQNNKLIKNCKLYLRYILYYSKNWALRLSLIFERFKSRFYQTDSAEKCPTQIDELVNAVESDVPSGFFRLKLIYSSSLLTTWNLLKERGSTNFGYVKSSLEAFEKFHLWDALISSHKELKMIETSVGIIRKLLEKKETVKLWCLLGDATDDISYYNKALELGNGNSYRPYRSLGDYFYSKQDYKSAIEHYIEIVDRNPHNHDVFRKLINCTLQEKRWQECKLYSEKYLLDADDFDGWSSLIRAYINLGEHENAQNALKEVVRFKEDSWTLWNDLMVTCASSGYTEEALDAYDNILKYQKKKVDVKTLENLANAIIKKKDADGKLMEKLYAKCLQIVSKLCQQSSKDSDAQFLYAELLYANPDNNQHKKFIAVQHYRKAVAIYAQKTGWEKSCDVTDLLVIITRCLKLIHLYNENIDFSDNKGAIFYLTSLRFLLSRIIEQIKKGSALKVDSVKTSFKSLEEGFTNLGESIKNLES